MNIKQQLTSIGFNDKESEIYLALLDMGKATPAELAQVTGIKRTTVYAVLGELLKKAVIGEDISARKHTFVSLPPSGLRNYIRQLQKQLHQTTTQVDGIVEALDVQQKEQQIHIPKVIFIQQDQLESYLYSRTPIWNASMEKLSADYVGYLDFTFTEMYQTWIDWYWNHPTTKNIKLRFLTNETEFEKQVMRSRNYFRRKLYFWEAAGEMTYNTWVNGEYTVMVNTRTRPFYLIEIYDKDLAQSQRQIFDAVWKEVIS